MTVQIVASLHSLNKEVNTVTRSVLIFQWLNGKEKQPQILSSPNTLLLMCTEKWKESGVFEEDEKEAIFGDLVCVYET